MEYMNIDLWVMTATGIIQQYFQSLREHDKHSLLFGDSVCMQPLTLCQIPAY